MEMDSILDKFRESFNRFKEDAIKREDALKKDLTNIKQVHSKLFQELEDSKKCQDLYKVEIIQLKSSLQKSSLLFREKVSVKDQVNHQLEQDNAHLVEQRKLDSQKIEQLVNTLYKMKRGFEDQFSKHKEEVSNNFCSYENKIKILMSDIKKYQRHLTLSESSRNKLDEKMKQIQEESIKNEVWARKVEQAKNEAKEDLLAAEETQIALRKEVSFLSDALSRKSKELRMVSLQLHEAENDKNDYQNNLFEFNKLNRDNALKEEYAKESSKVMLEVSDSNQFKEKMVSSSLHRQFLENLSLIIYNTICFK